MKKAKGNNEVKNCLSCGRETWGVSGYCKACYHTGAVNFDEKRDRHILRFGNDPVSWWTPLHEDRYDEEYIPKDIEK